MAALKTSFTGYTEETRQIKEAKEQNGIQQM